MSATQITMLEFLKSQDPEQLKAEIKKSIDAMTPEARQAFIADICASVGNISRSIVQNADEIWESRNDNV